MAATGRLRIQRSAERFTTVREGVQTRHLLSFGDQYDPELTAFGPLIAHNDETLGPGAGYDVHSHRGVEIVTWVVSGRLVHQGGDAAIDLDRGSAQLLSAGHGTRHAEIADASATEPTRFIQMWLRSDDPQAEPRHAVALADVEELRATLVPIAASAGAPLRLGVAGARCLVGRPSAGATRTLPAAGFAHVFVVHGAVELEGVGVARLDAGDSALITPSADAACVAVDDAEIVVWTWG